MSTISKIQKLAHILTDEQLSRLEVGARQHKHFSNIKFEILGVDDNEVIILTKQGRSFNGNLADQETLLTRTFELFEPNLPEIKLEVVVSPYLIPPVDDVTDVWIRVNMKETGKQIKDIVNDTGLSKSYLSAIVNGQKPLSRINKSFFYYYFQSKQLQRVFFGRDL